MTHVPFTRWGLHSALSADEFLRSPEVAMILMDDEGMLVDANATFKEWFSEAAYHPEKFADWWNAVREDGTPFLPEERPSHVTITTGEPSPGVVMGFDIPKYGRKWLLVSSFPGTYQGRPRGSVACCIDVTEKIETENLLRLTGMLSHGSTFATDETMLLQQTCETLVRTGRFSLARIAVTSTRNLDAIENIVMSSDAMRLRAEMVEWAATFPEKNSPSARALKDGVTSLCNDTLNEPKLAAGHEKIREFGLISVLAVPFSLNGTRAVLTVHSEQRNTFDPATVEAIERLTRELEFAVNEVQTVQQMREGLRSTMRTLASVVEGRNPLSAGHQRNVSRLAASIAESLGLNEHEALLIQQAGEVFDIGEIAVPAEILTRPGRLDNAEMRIMQSHTSAGYEMLSKAALPWPIAEVALQHHERLDGSGYPKGLVGDAISLPARIIAIADVVTAMTHPRPYRPAKSLDDALNEIRTGAGTLYDAEAVAACVEVLLKGFTFEEPAPEPSALAATARP
jgi:HD-GYP domain-containing protein (c-di-GMP phosphodiesterase class II)/ribosomal protein S6E (S10)